MLREKSSRAMHPAHTEKVLRIFTALAGEITGDWHGMF
jgi:hypothetical protein